MSDLTDDALAWITEQPGVASDERIVEIAAELLRLRAVVGAHPTGPDQDEPTDRAAITSTVADFLAGLLDEPTEGPTVRYARDLPACLDDLHPGWLRAREAQATTPRADEVVVKREELADLYYNYGALSHDSIRDALDAVPPAAAPGAEPVAWAVVGKDAFAHSDDHGALPAFITREDAVNHVEEYGDGLVKPLYGDPPAPGAGTTTDEDVVVKRTDVEWCASPYEWERRSEQGVAARGRLREAAAAARRAGQGAPGAES